MSTDKKDKCFIITPIGHKDDDIRRHIDGIIEAAIIPALGDKYDIDVSHEICVIGSIDKQVVSCVYESKLVIANITNRNPNVMYELALRHATGKPVIMIAEEGTPLPFDIGTQRTIFYHNDAKGVLELREDIIKFEKELDFDTPSGPIIEVLGDIRRDKTLLSENHSESGNNNPLEYIMSRLDRIESTIRTTQLQGDRGVFTKRTFNFTYDELLINIDDKFVVALNFRLRETNTSFAVETVEVDEKNKILSIKIYFYRYRSSIVTMIKEMESLLEQSGVKGAHLRLP